LGREGETELRARREDSQPIGPGRRGPCRKSEQGIL